MDSEVSWWFETSLWAYGRKNCTMRKQISLLGSQIKMLNRCGRNTWLMDWILLSAFIDGSNRKNTTSLPPFRHAKNIGNCENVPNCLLLLSSVCQFVYSRYNFKSCKNLIYSKMVANTNIGFAEKIPRLV